MTMISLLLTVWKVRGEREGGEERRGGVGSRWGGGGEREEIEGGEMKEVGTTKSLSLVHKRGEEEGRGKGHYLTHYIYYHSSRCSQD